MTWTTLTSLAPWLLAGLALGGVYMVLLARSVAAIAGPAAVGAAAAWLILRFGLAAIVLALAAMQGAGPLLAALVGFLIARTIAIRRVKGASHGG